MGDGVLVDLYEEDADEVIGPARLDWLRAQWPDLRFGTDDVLANSTVESPCIELPGLYFLVWRDRVCYVGQAADIDTRLRQHFKEGRPIDRIAFIVGLPRWALDEVEHAYIQAWDLPWNSERARCGQLRDLPEFVADLKAMDCSGAMPEYVPRVTAGHARWKPWRLQVLGRLQREAAEDASAQPAP